MSAVEGGSVPPPRWSQSQPVTARASAPAPIPLGQLAQSPAEAAVRWRISAAVIDNLLVNGLYLLVCLALHWQVASLSHLPLLLVLGALYHFILESRDGRTIGKRRYGIMVVSVDDEPAGPKAIAIRSALRMIDALPVWYLSGLVSMVRTGPARRQRIGDVAAETKVIAVEGLSASRGTPGWMLPAATLSALALSCLGMIGIARASHQTITSAQEAQFVAGCENSSRGRVDCHCFLSRLEANGHDTVVSINSVVLQAQTEQFRGQSGPARRELTADATACHR